MTIPYNASIIGISDKLTSNLEYFNIEKEYYDKLLSGEMNLNDIRKLALNKNKKVLPATSATPARSIAEVQSPPRAGVPKDISKVIMSGYLMKCGSRRHNWHKRWFTLSGEKLVYSRSHMVRHNFFHCGRPFLPSCASIMGVVRDCI